jgi:hypothetical protein
VNDKLSAITTGQGEIKGQLWRLESPSLTGWRRAGYLIVAIGSPVAIIALIVGILAFTGTAIYQLIAHVKEDTAFRGNTDSRLRGIEEKLGIPHPSPLQSKSVRPAAQQKSSFLQDFASLDEPQFSHEVGRLADAASIAQKSGVIDTVENVAKIQQKLANTPLTTPDSIRATASIINYSSFVREKTGAFPDATSVRAKPCQHVMIGDGVSPVNQILINMTNVEFRGCLVRLDGLSITRGVISNAIVLYDGGPVRLNNVKFINCLFEFRLPANYTPRAASFAKEILVEESGPNPTFTVSVE